MLFSFGKHSKLCDVQRCVLQTVFVFQLDMLYEGYKSTEMKENPKAHRLMKWLKNNIPKDGKIAGMIRFVILVRLKCFLTDAIKE